MLTHLHDSNGAESAAAAGDVPVSCLRGSAVGQDGRSSALTAPNGPAQQAVMRMALAEALLQPAHVTGLQVCGVLPRETNDLAKCSRHCMSPCL